MMWRPHIHATEYAKTVAIAVMGTDHRFTRMHLGAAFVARWPKSSLFLPMRRPKACTLPRPMPTPYYEKLGFTFCHGMCMTLPLNTETRGRMQEWRPRLKPYFEMAQGL